MGFDFHWFKLCLIAVVMLWVTHLCRVYSSCLSSCFFSLPKVHVSNTDMLQGFVHGYFSRQQDHKNRLDQHSEKAHMCQVKKL